MGSTNVDMIESSMKNCSLSSEDQYLQMLPLPDQTPMPEAPDQNTGEVPVEPKAQLPKYWSEYNDLRTGEKYYIKWDKLIRTNVDPRISEAEAEKAGYYLSDDESRFEYLDSDESSEGSIIFENSTGDSANSIPPEPVEDFVVVVGCSTCLKYYMVPHNALNCSWCNSPLIHFRHSGSA